MSHEVETMAYANQVPWHGLGARVDQDVTVPAMLKAAGLDWPVELLPLKATRTDGVDITVKDRFALVRETDNRVLTITGKSWHPLQNADCLGFMKDYVEAGGATLETAGSLRDGKIIWGLAKLKHSFEARKGDKVEGYLLITSPHEVGKAITIRTTTVRVVCANTMAMANSASTVDYSQNHLSDFNVKAAKEAIGNAHEQLGEAENRAKTLAKFKINLEDAVRKVIVPAVMPEVAKSDLYDQILLPENQPKTLQQIIDSLNNAPGADPKTGWGVLNGVTHWADHVAGRDQAARLHRAWVGDTARAKQRTEAALMELAA
jgi:phage/plasmid-like protein (TIGR03299 family)